MKENTVVFEYEAQEVPDEKRCKHVMADGQRCRNRRWSGKEVCFLHDPDAAGKRKNRGRVASRIRVLTVTEIHELLTRTLEKLHAGKVSAGEAYATGYLAQLLLGNLKRVQEEYTEVRNHWERACETFWRVLALDRGTYGGWLAETDPAAPAAARTSEGEEKEESGDA